MAFSSMPPVLPSQPNIQKGVRMNVVDVPEDKQQEAGLLQTIFSFFRPPVNNDQSCYVPKDCVYINLHLNKHFHKHVNKIFYASLSKASEQAPKVQPFPARRATLSDMCDDLSFPPRPYSKLPKSSSPNINVVVEHHEGLQRREIGIPTHIRKWAKLELDADVFMSPLELDGADEQTVISTVVFEVDFESKARQLDSFSYCSNSMARDFRKQFINHIFTQEQEVFFEFVSGNVRKRRFTEDPMSVAQQEDEEYTESNMKPTHKVVFAFSVKQLYCVTLGNQAALKKIKFGILKEDSTIKFMPVKNSTLQMFGSSLTKATPFTDQLAQNSADKSLTKPLSKQPLSSSFPKSSLSSIGSTSSNKTAPIPLSQITACPNKDIKLTVIENPEEYPSSSKDHKVVIHPEDYNVAEHGANLVLTYGPADNQHQIVVAASNLSSYSSNQIPKGQIAIGKALADDIDLEVGSSVVINQVTEEDNNLTAKHVVVDVSTPTKKKGSESQLYHSEEVAKALKKVMINRFMNLNKCNYVSVEKSNTSDDMFDMFCGSRGPLLIYKVTSISLDPPKDSAQKEPKKADYAVYRAETTLEVISSDNSVSFFGEEAKNGGELLNFDWNFEKMGIGGLDKQCDEIFRRAFASRLLSEKCRKEMGINHLRGILLHGPPGTGKTLLARKIAEMLNAREPKLVNGPEIFGMYLGQSESNIRKLFADAEKEWAAVGNNSRLHVIIFDEFDSIVPNRRHLRSTGRTDSRVVNQLLSKLDGLEQLNNILVIGMTNQLELIDPAILRPGRMEIQMEIHLPDEEGRHQILKIHTQKMKDSNRLSEDVDLAEIAKQCANYSGAEIEGLVRAAQSHAVKRFLGDGKQKQVTEEADTDSLKIINEDFQSALKKDITPHFGNANAMITHILHRPIIHWCPEISQVLSKGDEAIKQTLAKNGPGFVKILLIGAKQTGKTFLAAEIAKESKMNFVKLVTAASLGRNKISELEQAFDDAAASALSCLFIDNLERIADYSEASETFSNQVALKLSELIERRPKEGKRLLVVATCSSQKFITDARLKHVFSCVVQVPSIKEQQHITSVVKSLNLFDTEEMQLFHKHLNQLPTNLELSIQQLLEIVDSVRMEDEDESVVAGEELGPVKHNKRVEKFFKGLEAAIQETPAHSHMYA